MTQVTEVVYHGAQRTYITDHLKTPPFSNTHLNLGGTFDCLMLSDQLRKSYSTNCRESPCLWIV